MIEPHTSGSRLLRDILAADPEPGSVEVWRLGQAGVVCSFPGPRRVVFDPYLSNHCEAVLPAPFDHRRMTRAPLDGSELGFADVLVLSHDHLDHLDVPTFRSAARLDPRPIVVAPTSCRPSLVELGWSAEHLVLTEPGAAVQVAGLSVTTVAVPHDDYDRTPEGYWPYQAHLVGDGSVTVAHLGDSRADAQLVASLRCHDIDLAFLPVNGRDEQRARLGFAGNTTAAESVELAVAAGTGAVVPVHYDMFEQNVDPGAVENFTALARRAGLAHRVLEVGQRWTCTPDRTGTTRQRTRGDLR